MAAGGSGNTSASATWRVGTTSAADCAAAVATDGCCQAPTDSGFNDAGQVAYKTEWRETDHGEAYGSCAGNSCGGGDAGLLR